MTIVLTPTVAGLPEGPATAASVKAQLNITDDKDDANLQLAIQAVNNYVAALPIIDTINVDNVDEWPAQLQYGATLLSVRLFRRADSPIGIAAFGDQGAVYVQRNDPDVAMMLGLGQHRRPAVG